MEECIFCHQIEPDKKILESRFFFVVLDIDPLQQGHLLLISKKHYHSLAEIPAVELLDLLQLEKDLLTIFEVQFSTLGVSFIQNNGDVMEAGTHFHVHLVPRYDEDNFWENQKIVFHELDLLKLKKAIKKSAL